jgi:hypothetical protein
MLSAPASGGIEKLTVIAYGKPDCQGPELGRFAAQVNPAELTTGYEYDYTAAQGSGTTATRADFNKSKASDLQLSFFLDGTGADRATPTTPPQDVLERVAAFHKVTGYNGDLHRPPYLVVVWGKLEIRRCVIKSVQIVYKLFRADGVPLRALVNAVFTEAVDDTTRVTKEERQSADLTHLRTVKAGDSLPLLCHEIYGEALRCVQVARANGLDHFRELRPGQQIVFPPIEKA